MRSSPSAAQIKAVKHQSAEDAAPASGPRMVGASTRANTYTHQAQPGESSEESGARDRIPVHFLQVEAVGAF